MSVKSLPKLPKQKSLDSWKDKSKWLTIENGYLFCKWCMKYEQRISSTKAFSKKFTDGLNHLNSSRINEHEKGEPHKTAKRYKEQDEAKERGETYRLDVPTDAPIVQSFKRTRHTESEGLQKLFDVAYVAINHHHHQNYLLGTLYHLNCLYA